MPTTSPPFPTLAGSTLTIDTYLNDPVRFARAVADYAKTHAIAPYLLKARIDATGSGTALIEAIGNLFSDGVAEPIAQLQDYPMVGQSNGAPSLVNTVKNGVRTQFAQEMVSRSRYDVFQRKTQTLVNDVDKVLDALAITALASVSSTSAVIAAWATTATANPLLDIELADAKIREAGDTIGLVFNPDIVVARPVHFAYLIGQLAKGGILLPVEQAVAYATGIAYTSTGKTYLRSNASFGSGTKAFVADSTMLGGIVTENLSLDGRGNSLDTGFVRIGEDPLDVEVFVERIQGVDGWEARARKVAVPFVDQPTAGIWITGVS